MPWENLRSWEMLTDDAMGRRKGGFLLKREALLEGGRGGGGSGGGGGGGGGEAEGSRLQGVDNRQYQKPRLNQKGING